MRTIYFKILYGFVAGMIFLFCSCNKSEPVNMQIDLPFNGSRQSVQQFVTPQLFTIMQNLGLTMHYGNVPPILNGQYLASELLLQASNIPTDIPYSEYSDTYFTFEEQNNRDLTIKMSHVTDNGTESSRGNGAMISGNGNNFTVLTRQTIIEDLGTADTVMIISGKLSAQGIIDFQFALFMLNNHGLEGFIDNRQGRLFYDSDNLAEKQY